MPHEPSPGTGTLSNYAVGIGGGSVTATSPAAGATITAGSQPAAGAGVKYPYIFPTTTTGSPATTAGTSGTYDPVAKTGAINFAGTLTFTAHGQTFWSVVNPRLQFDAPQSVRLIANGQIAAGAIGSNTPPADYGTTAARQTVFALDGTQAQTTVNPDGSYTISNLIPSGTPAAAPTSFLSSSTVFDSIRTWFTIDRPNQSFSVTFAPKAEDPPTPPAPTGSDQTLGVSGTVGSVLDLKLNTTAASLGSFVPGVANNYDASITGTATSTGPSVLTVRDTGANAGFLLNGTTPLAAALKACATTSAAPTCSYSTVGATAQQLLAFPSSVVAAPLTVGLRQAIGATDVLTAGTYGKTLTFTLSAGTP
ncbi:MAG TPA: hypothetical protein VFG42_19835 [Baekduia sp.]|uniref:hypothetical protein n=1 Tax=Baekduia sp. TaxID=2600305 RepID=UPI002D76D137|nr:hypothetical protein [Baekduia sp.]HET6509055.1 hypothetical protein [Baekduia sp.]